MGHVKSCLQRLYQSAVKHERRHWALFRLSPSAHLLLPHVPPILLIDLSSVLKLFFWLPTHSYRPSPKDPLSSDFSASYIQLASQPPISAVEPRFHASPPRFYPACIPLFSMFPAAQAAAAYSLVKTKNSDRLFLLNLDITARVGRNGRQCVEAPCSSVPE
ncbi:hypothetical protein GYMLUDRAFT_341602 [Collybiopsis luxurians FD-317 M1]|nr:hypothetical protein GYMLUDRAFT_341602 [Collybiopsis luxurians FD-317 M1]